MFSYDCKLVSRNFVQSFLYGTNEIDNVGAIKNFVFTAKLIDHNEIFII